MGIKDGCINYIWDDTQKPSGMLSELSKFVSTSKQHSMKPAVNTIIKKESADFDPAKN